MREAVRKDAKQRELDLAISQGATYWELRSRDVFYVDDNGFVINGGDYSLERCFELRLPRLHFMLRRCEVRTLDRDYWQVVHVISPDEVIHKTLFSDEYCDQLIEESERYLQVPVEMSFTVDPEIADREFYSSPAWLKLRYKTLIRYDSTCMACKRPKSQTGSLHVDHIKPRSKYPHLALDPENLQILCMECNIGKSNRFEHDHRRDS